MKQFLVGLVCGLGLSVAYVTHLIGLWHLRLSRSRNKGSIMNVSVVVVYPIYLEIDVPNWERLSLEERRKIIIEKADNCFESSTVAPIIQECSDPELEE